MAQLLGTECEGRLIKEYYLQDGITYCKTTDVAAPHILLSNERVRRDPGALKKQDGYKWALSIPEDCWMDLVKKYPDLASPHSHTQRQAMARFMKSSESLPFRVVETKRGQTA